VSGVGDDVNPCSRTAPCKTFAGAISKTAENGYINAIDPGGFGAVTITKGMTIDGEGVQAGVLAGGGNGIVVNAPGQTVILRNLSIEGSSFATNGIRIVAAARVFIERCTISNFVNNGILVVGAAEVFVSDTTIKNIADQGIYVQAGRTTVTRVLTSGSSIGVLAGIAGSVTVKDSVSTGNETGYGAAYAAASQITIEGSVMSQNKYGVLAIGGASVRLSDSTITGNTTTAMYNDGLSQLVSFGNNRFAGNASDGLFTATISLR
jgi:nitrous oxidase accessory protein NosD